jgi:hypothetical protein
MPESSIIADPKRTRWRTHLLLVFSAGALSSLILDFVARALPPPALPCSCPKLRYQPEWVLVAACWNDINEKSSVRVNTQGYLIANEAKYV